jgi:ssDNA-binding Zn-finger/Zn-ribbon topoisomerase 1
MGGFMPKCPKCGEEIDTLIYWRWEESEYYMWIPEGSEQPELERIPRFDEDYDEGYECPECRALLFKSRGEAIDFLKSETNP